MSALTRARFFPPDPTVTARLANIAGALELLKAAQHADMVAADFGGRLGTVTTSRAARCAVATAIEDVTALLGTLPATSAPAAEVH